MSKQISSPQKRHDFLLNFNKSPPSSVDHYDFLSMQPHSKDSFIDGEEQISLNQDRVATATDYISGKNLHVQSSLSHGKRSHAKKKSVDNPKDTVTHLLSTPSSTTNAKMMNQASQLRAISRSNTAHHLNFLNSKEFARLALSKVLPKDPKKDKVIHLELSPQQKRSPTGSLEKSPQRNFAKEDSHASSKYHMAQTKKQKVKPRASNMTENDLSSVGDQTRQVHSFVNSPQKKSNVYISIPPTKSTTNLRPSTTKNSYQLSKNALLQASNEAFKKLETNNSKKQQGASSYEGSRSKERNKGMQSIASILNLRRDKKGSPEKKANSCYPGSSYHRKVASSGAQNLFNNSSNHQTLQSPVHHTASIQEEQRVSLKRSPSRGKKSSSSPVKREHSAGKKTKAESVAAKGMSLDQYAGLQSAFEYLLEKFRCDMQNSQETYIMLKQAKQAYESFITELLMQLQGQKEVHKVTDLEKELRFKCETLAKEKEMLEEQVRHLRLDNQRLYSMMSGNREREPLQNIANSSKRTYNNTSEGIPTSPGLQQMTSDSENLQKLVANQQGVIEALQSKEAKLMQLLYTIHKRGFDVETLIREEALKDSNNSEHQSMRQSSKGNISLQEQSNRSGASGLEICSLITSQDMSDILPDYKELVAKYGGSDAKTSDSSPYLGGNAFNSLSAPMKDKLKLDFHILPKNQTEVNQNLGNQQPDNNAEPLGFHDEFMAKIEEFSLSWRLEAMNQRNF